MLSPLGPLLTRKSGPLLLGTETIRPRLAKQFCGAFRCPKPIILVIDFAKTAADRYKFRLSENGVWLTDHVPSGYIRVGGNIDG